MKVYLKEIALDLACKCGVKMKWLEKFRNSGCLGMELYGRYEDESSLWEEEVEDAR